MPQADRPRLREAALMESFCDGVMGLPAKGYLTHLTSYASRPGHENVVPGVDCSSGIGGVQLVGRVGDEEEGVAAGAQMSPCLVIIDDDGPLQFCAVIGGVQRGDQRQ